MGRLEVPSIIFDQDILETVTLIRSHAGVNEYGENEMHPIIESVLMAVQNATQKDIENLPHGVNLTWTIKVYYQGELCVEDQGQSADLIQWNGKQYKVIQIPEDFTNQPGGFTCALAIWEKHAD